MKIKKNNSWALCLILPSLVLPSVGLAKENIPKFPLGCQDTGYVMNLRTLTLLSKEAGEQNSMYFVYNRLNTPVNFYHMHHDKNYFDVFLNHRVGPDRWAVFSTNEPEVKFVCTVDSSGLDYGRIIDCKDALAVCEYTKVKFGLNNRGNHWIVNGNTMNGAIREVVRYGIIPAY